MKLDQTFSVAAPIDRVWTTLMDVEQVARCLPGAQVLDEVSADSYRVGMKVKLGPITMSYRGQLDVVERDSDARRATLRGKAQETRGQGTASATVSMQLTAEGDRTVGTVQADVRLSGRAAAMGQGVISSVADQVLGQFATNLEAMLTPSSSEPAAESPAVDGPAADGSRSGETVTEGVDRMSAGSQHEGVIFPPEEAKPGGSPVEQTRGDTEMTQGQVVTDPSGVDTPLPAGPTPSGPVSGAAQSQATTGARVSDRAAAGAGPSKELPPWPKRRGAGQDSSLDAMALGRSMVGAQLQKPRVQVGLATLLALVAYLLGRRATRV